MADKTGIEWTDMTWNPVVGCSIVSPGCTNCYAMGQAARIVAMAQGAGRDSHYAGTVESVKGKPVWTGNLALAPESILLAPLRKTSPRRIFVNSMGDLFHEDVPDAWIDRVFAIMALTPQHTYQILTKRSARMRAYIDSAFERIVEEMMVHTAAGYACVRESCEAFGLPWTQPRSASDWWPLTNVWLGVSAEDQRRADERIPDLLATPAAIRFVSAEPLLGAIDFVQIDLLRQLGRQAYMDALDGGLYAELPRPPKPPFPFRDIAKVDWIIVGGESGPGARPMHPDWARSIRDQCASAGTAFYFKQWGEWRPDDIRGAGVAELAWLRNDGRREPWPHAVAMDTPNDERKRWSAIAKIGKARAGRLLDGVEYSAFPEVSP